MTARMTVSDQKALSGYCKPHKNGPDADFSISALLGARTAVVWLDHRSMMFHRHLADGDCSGLAMAAIRLVRSGSLSGDLGGPPCLLAVGSVSVMDVRESTPSPAPPGEGWPESARTLLSACR
jgi:hypothetical protein